MSSHALIEFLHAHDNNVYTLIRTFALHHGVHPTLPLVVLNYDVHDSPRNHAIVDVCRGIVLEYDPQTFVGDQCMQCIGIVAQGFERFYEDTDQMQTVRTRYKSDTQQVYEYEVQTKEDGTLMYLFWYHDQWIWSTRYNFGEDSVHGDHACTYTQLAWNTLGAVQPLPQYRNTTLVFELCTAKNRIIQLYDPPQIFLLACFSRIGDTHPFKEQNEQFLQAVQREHSGWMLSRPTVTVLSTWAQVEEQLNPSEPTQHIFEGFVVRPRLRTAPPGAGYDPRVKIKTKVYKFLHRLKYRGWHTLTNKLIVDWDWDPKDVLTRLIDAAPLPQYEQQYLHDRVHQVRRERSALEALYAREEQDMRRRLDQRYSLADMRECIQTSVFKAHWFRYYYPVLYPTVQESERVQNAQLTIKRLVINGGTDEQDAQVAQDYCIFTPELHAQCTANEVRDGLAEQEPLWTGTEWQVRCYCGEAMDLCLLKSNRVIPFNCPCGHYTGKLKTYPVGSMIWTCRNKQVCPLTMESKNTEHHDPLGRPASAYCKTLRLIAHDLMQRWLTKDRRLALPHVYAKLEQQFGMPIHMARCGSARAFEIVCFLQQQLHTLA